MIVLKGAGNIRNADITVTRFPFLLGRKENALVDLAKNSETFAEELSFLSRKHASLSQEQDRVFIADQGSLNGTEKNGKAVGQQGSLLCHGDNLSFAGKLSFVYENSNEQKEGQLLELELGVGSRKNKKVEISTFPSIIGQSSADSFAAMVVDKGNLQNEKGNIVRISCENGAFFVEELGSGTPVQLNGQKLDKQKERFEEGGTLQIGSKLKLQFPMTTPTAEMSVEDKTAIHASAAAPDIQQDSGDKTVYMESPTQFIKVVTGEEDDGQDLHTGGTDQQQVAPSRSFPVKGLIYCLLVMVGIAAVWGGVHLYTNTGMRKAVKLVKKGENLPALAIVEEKLGDDPDDKTASSLLFQIVVKEYLTPYASAILKGDMQEARSSLDHSKQYDQYNPKIQRFNALSQLFLDLSQTVTDPENPSMKVELVKNYISLDQLWKKDVLENRSILEELVTIDPIFVELRKDVYARLNALKLIVNRKVGDIKAFQDKMKSHLENNTPEEIESLLGDKKLLADVEGTDIYKADLQHYLEFHKAVAAHDATLLLTWVENSPLKSELFISYHKKRVDTELPDSQVLSLLSKGQNAWNNGQTKKAVALMRSVESSRWQQYIGERLEHMEKTSQRYEELLASKGSLNYPRALMEFRNDLTVGKDDYFARFADSEAEGVKGDLQGEYERQLAQFRDKWELYLDGGRISTIQRMENSISENFKRQAERLMAASKAYEQSKMLLTSFNLTPSADMEMLGQQLTEEVIFQRQMVVDLHMVLNRQVYEGKLQLLPEKKL